MHIKRIQLENIKSHLEAVFDFERGTTAISGENGAGKTTLIEAAAWVLFDVLDYKKDDFVSRGAKKGNARVTIESGLDEREYVIYRDTGTGYYVYDPQLETRIAEKKEDVSRFLRKHLAVEPGTDIEMLYKHAIGVPQGTFTAIFLATAAERKRTFDVLLKVEEYRRGAEELLKTQRFVESRIGVIDNKASRFEGELARADSVAEELAATEILLRELKQQVDELRRKEDEAKKRVAELEEAKDRFDKAAKEKEVAESERGRAELILKQAEAEFERARESSTKIDAVREAAGRHREALKQLAELERERGVRDGIKAELAKVETAEAAIKIEERHTRAEILSIENAHRELTELRPKAEEQISFEKELAAAREELSGLRAVAKQVEAAEERLRRLRASYKSAEEELEKARAKAAGAENAETLEVRDSEITAELARLNAELERDEKFQAEIRNGLCPILSEKCLNLKPGQTLDGFLVDQFAELRTAIDRFGRERTELRAGLAKAKTAERFAVQVPTLERRFAEVKEEGVRLAAERDELRSKLEQLPAAEAKVTEIEARLDQLGDPRSRIRPLEALLARETEVRESVTKIESNMERLESERRLFVEQLDDFVKLDADLQTATAERDATEEAYRTFIAFEQAAKDLPRLEDAFRDAVTAFEKASEQASAAVAAFEEATRGYDPEAHAAAGAELGGIQRDMAGVEVRIESAEKRLAALNSESGRLAEIRKELSAELQEKERQEKILETTVFIRDTLKEAAPLVARNYVFHVSAEANRIFREVGGNAERTLRWGEDYGVYVEEGGHERPFISLSGGEQMSAALAVRLALLKQLSDIRIAFFDEPTTNMDAERRENLAMQIGQITHFDQLFVISHDDTFEGYLDHEITVEGQ
ncbi:MAG: AAA family ATPase [Acidobacteria bacterium]|nr:AAA family ATPase [Acidobacteriota bacterium]